MVQQSDPRVHQQSRPTAHFTRCLSTSYPRTGSAAAHPSSLRSAGLSPYTTGIRGVTRPALRDTSCAPPRIF